MMLHLYFAAWVLGIGMFDFNFMMYFSQVAEMVMLF